jgi:predicted AAA+ superfamily ATPase
MYIYQKQLDNLSSLVAPGKVVLIYGPRRVGKTTLINKYSEGLSETEKKRILMVTGDDIGVREYLESESVSKLKDFVGDRSLLFVDEAQRISHIGLNLKLIVDNIPGIRIIATGSSSIDLARDTGAPLTGRKFTLKLYPLSQIEIGQREAAHQTKVNLESRLIYGSYPEVIINRDNRFRREYLAELISSYLFKDIFELEGIRHSGKLVRLLRLLAFQIGSEVSISELGTQLGMSKNTVDRYLDLLEKAFVIFRREGFSRNLRKEITKSSRFYFLDLGVRNAVIDNFNPLELRNDTGQLWENYIIMERMKKLEYMRDFKSSWFWRTYDKKEIDLIEEGDGKLNGYEIKFQRKSSKPPADWARAYPRAGFKVISRDNYIDFIT